MLRCYVEQLLNVFNYIDALIVTNTKANIEYYFNIQPRLNRLREEDILGMNILDLYPDLTEETSSIYRVLRSGQPIYNEFQSMRAVKTNQIFNGLNTTIPIKHNNKIIGVAEITRWVEDPFQRKYITVSSKQSQGSASGSNSGISSDDLRLYTIDDIITCSPQMEEIKERIRLISETDSTVLIYGQTGTGKELVAQSIHTSGRRRKNRFVSQNCAAIPDTLLESILFGTTKGSYTGAENRPGLFEIANGGTLFLDEINSMEPGMQAKLLKVIEEKKVTRIGGSVPVPIDVKIVSAVNEPPEYCVQNKKLRKDLFYRLSVVRLDIPPLAERPEDIKLLTRYFIDYFNVKMSRDVLYISEEAERLFLTYPWPGNVRELKNIIEGAYNVIPPPKIIHLSDLAGYLTGRSSSGKTLPASFQPPEHNTLSRGNSPEEWTRLLAEHGRYMADGGKSLAEMTSDFEKEIIQTTLKDSRSISEAAKKLRITKQGLCYKIQKYDIDV